MNITTQQVLWHFLQQQLKALQEKQSHDKKNPEKMNAFFDGFFTHSELMQILHFVYGDEVDNKLKVETLTNNGLLEFLSEAQILSYFLHEWKNEQNFKKGITPQAVWDTLQQLGHHTHYLGSKVIAHWDEYDYSNYKSLQQKAGKIQKVFELYGISVDPEEINEVTSSPKRLYDKREQALMAREELGFTEEEVHVLEIYKPT